MKKLLLMFVFVCFTCLGASADQFLRYNNAGVPSRVMSLNGYSRSINRFGSNAAFTPKNQARATARARAIRRENAINKALENSGNQMARYAGRNTSQRAVAMQTSSVPVSRFDKNYSVNRVQKTYSKGGVTFYN